MHREREIQALIVHHDSLDTLQVTIRSLKRDGIPARSITVVDNSDASPGELDGVLERDIVRVHMQNEGFAAAVNRGARELDERGCDLEQLVLVGTHELRLAPGAVGALARSLEDPQVVAAGPVLLGFHGHADRIWSAGGNLDRRTAIPSHRMCGASASRLDSSLAPYSVAWLDGACVVYRLGTLLENPMDERYFLYFEEVDLHTRVASRGTILVVPAARAWQSTLGTPPYYLARNYLLFSRGRAQGGWRLVGLLLVALRLVSGTRRLLDLMSAVRGIRDYLRGRWGADSAS